MTEPNRWLARVGQFLGLAANGSAASGVTWLLLPPYDIPEMAVVSGLLVENQGTQAEHDIYVELAFPEGHVISHMEVSSDAPLDIEGGTPRDSRVALRLPELSAGSRVVLYVAGHSPAVPEVVVAVQAARRAGIEAEWQS